MVKQYEQIQKPVEWMEYVDSCRQAADIEQLQRGLSVYDTSSADLQEKAIAIADMLLRLDLDTETVTAALLYPAYKKELIHAHYIEEHFGEGMLKLLSDCMQMRSLSKLADIDKYEPHQIETLRKMLLAMVTDIRAVLIVLAERLWQLRDAKVLSPEAQKKLANETLHIYAPLANRIGIWQLKWEIEDLCLRYLEPDIYVSIAKSLASRRVERVKYLAAVTDLFTLKLQQAQVKDFKIAGRVKHIYSIYKKMQRKNVSIEEIYDISALRVLVKSIEDCYAVLGMLQNEYEHIPEEFDDYVAQPKPNGYQSIHTVLYGPDNKVIEVQIRTFEMHDTSELGAASHWRYKEGLSQEAAYEAKIALLRQIMAWQKEVAAPEHKPDEQVQDIFADRVYVFTPMGDIIDLPQGSTPIDFAYSIHSEVGHRCRGAKANGKMVPLTYHLQTGDRMEIMTTKVPNPSRDWLNPHLGYIKSGRAHSVLAHWFRVKDSDQEKELKKMKVAAPVPPPAPKKVTEQHIELTREAPRKQADQITGIDSLLTRFASCCKPLPGDSIVGYITKTRGVNIHRRDCRNISHMLENDTDRFMEVGWSSAKTTAGRYAVDLLVRAQERANLLRDITGALSNEDVHVVGLRAQVDKETEASIYITITITSVGELNKAIKLLQQVHSVDDVRRL